MFLTLLVVRMQKYEPQKKKKVRNMRNYLEMEHFPKVGSAKEKSKKRSRKSFLVKCAITSEEEQGETFSRKFQVRT